MVFAAMVLTGAPAAAAPVPTPSSTPTPGATAPAPTVGAPGTISWSVQAATVNGPDTRKTFNYTNLKPGVVVHDYVAVTNFSPTPVTFEMHAADALNDQAGDFSLLAADQKSKDLGTWVSFAKDSVVLQPNERANLAFTVTVPSGATPGDHAGGIIASTLFAATNAQGLKVNVDRRVAVPLFIRVSGPLHPGLTIESVSTRYHGTYNPFGSGSLDVTYTVHNTGNERLNLSQDVRVTGFFGFTLARAHAKTLTDLLPGATYQATLHLNHVFPAGLMKLHIDGVPSEPAGMPIGQTTPENVAFGVSMWATPWLLLLFVVGLVGGFFGGWWLVRSRRARREEKVAAAVSRARLETVEQLRKKAAAKAAAGGGGSDSGGASG
jgi:hypothetical protein